MLVVMIVLFGLALAIAAVLKKKSTQKPDRGRFESQPPMTRHAQSMFWRLVEAFPAPDFVVLAQVSLGALLIAKGGASRYNFAQKRADFVLLSKGFLVLAIIELDDSSRKGKEQKDASRDAMLKSAGYKTVRYRKIPDVERVRADLTKELQFAMRYS